MFYSNINIVNNTLRENMSIFSDGLKKRKKIVLLNCITDKSYYKEIYNIYGVLLLRYNYGINKYLSDLYMYTNGFHRRTMYYFVTEMFSLQYFLPYINKIVYSEHLSYLKKKFDEHTYWSVSYMHRYPCRGQRRRSNASTPHKLNILSKFNTIQTGKKKSANKKSTSTNVNKKKGKKRRNK